MTTASPYRTSHPARPNPADPGKERASSFATIEFADPRIVRAVYRRDDPLEGRDMLLEVRFWGLQIPLRRPGE